MTEITFAAVTYGANLRGMYVANSITFATEAEANEFASQIVNLAWFAGVDPWAAGFAEAWRDADAARRAEIRADLEARAAEVEARLGRWEFSDALLDSQRPPSWRGAANSGKVYVVAMCDHGTWADGTPHLERHLSCREHNLSGEPVAS